MWTLNGIRHQNPPVMDMFDVNVTPLFCREVCVIQERSWAGHCSSSWDNFISLCGKPHGREVRCQQSSTSHAVGSLSAGPYMRSPSFLPRHSWNLPIFSPGFFLRSLWVSLESPDVALVSPQILSLWALCWKSLPGLPSDTGQYQLQICVESAWFQFGASTFSQHLTLVSYLTGIQYAFFKGPSHLPHDTFPTFIAFKCCLLLNYSLFLFHAFVAKFQPGPTPATSHWLYLLFCTQSCNSSCRFIPCNHQAQHQIPRWPLCPAISWACWTTGNSLCCQSRFIIATRVILCLALVLWCSSVAQFFGMHSLT